LRLSEGLKWSVWPKLIIFVPSALRTHYANAQIQFIMPIGLGLAQKPPCLGIPKILGRGHRISKSSQIV